MRSGVRLEIGGNPVAKATVGSLLFILAFTGGDAEVRTTLPSMKHPLGGLLAL